jgi:hypothetical protein
MNRALGYSDEELEALDRVLVGFPGTTVGDLEPTTEDLPDVTLTQPEPVSIPPQMVDGLTFALGAVGEEPAIMGRGDDVLWSPGEPMGIVGPDGVGKTTLVQQLQLCRVGIRSELLGMYVEPAIDKVLYISADRPKQAQRSLWRMVQSLGRLEHAHLREGLIVWRGPLPFDVVKQPGDLVNWADDLGASDVFLDSLGFIVPRLIEDETGSAIAQAFTAMSVGDKELVWLGHPRKASGENKKPNKIEDCYGSRWITAASGSVVSLWANPGDPVVEVKQLKSPAGEVGPFLMSIDHTTGDVSVVEGTDLLGQLRAAPNGLSAKEAGRFMEAANERSKTEKARRKLESFIGRRLAYRSPGVVVRGALSEPDRYYATPPESLREGQG